MHQCTQRHPQLPGLFAPLCLSGRERDNHVSLLSVLLAICVIKGLGILGNPLLLLLLLLLLMLVLEVLLLLLLLHVLLLLLLLCCSHLRLLLRARQDKHL